MNQWDDFDCALATDLSQFPPPPETVQAVNPWRTAINRIILGLCLTCFTLNFLYLQYLLPAVGAIQTYLGFRTLRNNNRWFRLSWYISICKVILLYCNLALAATPWEPVSPLLTALPSTALTLLLLLGLRQGLWQITLPFGERRDPVLWALVWYLVLVLLALCRQDLSWPGAILLIAVFALIVRSLGRVRDQMETLGYAMEAAPVRLDSTQVLTACLGSLTLVLLLASTLSCHSSLDSAAIEQKFESPETAAIRQELTSLGLPESVVELLRSEDLSRLSGAVGSTEAVGGLPLGNVGEDRHQNQVFALYFPDGSVQLLHVFAAGADGTIWQNGLTLRSNAVLSEVTGHLFYTQRGTAMAAPLSFEEPVTVNGVDQFFGQPYQECSAESEIFSWPIASRDRRGYVLARADQEANPQTTLTELLTACSASTPQYPYRRPRGRDWSYGHAFYYGDGSGLTWKADEARKNAPA